MKRVLMLVFALTMAFVSCTKESKDNPYNPDGSLITQAQALEIVKEDIDQYDVVYVSKSIVKKGAKFKTFGERYGRVPCDSWVVVINTEPLANSGPYWLYIYVDSYSGNADNDSWEWGLPENVMTDYECVKYDLEKYADTKVSCLEPLNVNKDVSTTAIAVYNWAVIISGGANPYSNYERYWNDCSAIYKCLRQVYGYRRERILVLMSDGTSSGQDRLMNNGTYMSSLLDLDGDGTDDINYSATRSNLSKVFNYLKGQVKSGEQVVVFVTDHGDRRNGESYICLWNEEVISSTEFAREVKKIDSSVRKHIVLGQCYSGGFVEPLLSCGNVSVATASESDKLSYAMSGLKYDEFLYHWISAAVERTPDGQPVDADKNGYPGVSAYEMFRYAKDNDSQDEKPQYSSKSESIGEEYGLSGKKLGFPALSGPYNISSSSNDNRFELRDFPSIDNSINWTSSSNISLTSNFQPTTMAGNVSVEAMEKGWIQAEIKTQFKTYTLWNRAYLWKPGMHTSDNLITGSLQECTFSLPYCVIGCNEYNWYISSRDYDDMQAESYFIEFTYTGDGNPGDYDVSVNFLNPLGEDTTIRRCYNG